MSNEDRPRVACKCSCHLEGSVIIHFAPCCKGGWIYPDEISGFFPPENDLGKAWDKLKAECFISHKGYIAEKLPTGIMFKGILYPDIEHFHKAVEYHINEAGNHLKDSINRDKHE